MKSFLTGQVFIGWYIHGSPIWYGVSSPMFPGVIVGGVPISAGLSSPGIQNHPVSTFDLVLISLTWVPTNSRNVPVILVDHPQDCRQVREESHPFYLQPQGVLDLLVQPD